MDLRGNNLELHLFLQNIRVLVNLGSRTFRYQEANNQRSSQESIQSISMEEARANLAELPFCDCSESDEQEEVIDDPRSAVHSGENDGIVLHICHIYQCYSSFEYM